MRSKMNIPTFPEPPTPISRSVSLQRDNREWSVLMQARRRRGEFAKRRPRSASWLVARKHKPTPPPPLLRRCSNHVLPFEAVAVAPANTRHPSAKRQLSTELTLTMTQTGYDQAGQADERIPATLTGTVEVLERIRWVSKI